MGFNSMGQLGLGHNDKNANTNDLNCIQSLYQKKVFITDVKATMGGVSIALDKDGTVWRWGVNQFEKTSEPIRNSFGDIINYKVSQTTQFAQPTPFAIEYLFFNTANDSLMNQSNKFMLERNFS